MASDGGEAFGREARFADALAILLRHPSFREGRVRDAFRQLTETGAAELGIARAGLWTYAESGDSLVCRDLYVVSEAHHRGGQSLDRASAPNYFRALERRRVIAAHDARTDPATSEFRDSYLIPEGITSMLDAPIVAGGSTVGVVCFEHIGPRRRFAPEDRAFAASLADLAATMLEVERRRMAEDELRLALEAVSMGTFRLDLESGRCHFSRTTGPLFGMLLGYAPADLGAWLALVHPEDRTLLAEAFAPGESPADSRSFRVEHRLADPALGSRVLECRGRVELLPDGRSRDVRGVVTDVTERHRMEQQVAHAQRVEVLGRFAGSIAHDVNNVLTAIHGYAARLGRSVKSDARAAADVQGIEAAVDRAASLTRQLLVFARRQATRPGTVEVDACIARLAGMLERLLGEDVELVSRPSAPGAWAPVEESQLEQVVVNLVVNARDAMPRGGRVRITTSAAHLTSSTPELRAGDYVVISISDTGVGVAPELLARIVEPFFSTKPTGVGTGLGLSTCQAIALHAGGNLRITSTVDLGSTFEVWLPRVETPAAPREASPVEVAPAGPARILLVEDDPVVRELAHLHLDEAGHRVDAADGRCSGVERLDPEGADYDLLVTDVVLADGSGLELAEVFRQRFPDRPVLFVSGFAPRTLERRGVRIDEAEFLEKPFRPADLRARIDSALGAARARRAQE